MKKIYLSFIMAIYFMYSNAQVVYTDVNPNETYSVNDSVELDVNGNGSVDLKIFAKDLSYTSNLGDVMVTQTIYATKGWLRTKFVSVQDISLSFGPFEWNNTSPYYYPKATALDLLDTICNEPSVFSLAILAEKGSKNATIGNPGSHIYGNFIGQNHKYLGGWATDTTAGGVANSFYFWIGLDVAADASSFTLKDYGFEASGACLLAGEGTPTTNVSSSMKESVKLNYSNQSVNLKIENANYNNGTLAIYDLNGKIVSNISVSQANVSLGTSKLKKGVYIASYTTASAGKSIRFFVD